MRSHVEFSNFLFLVIFNCCHIQRNKLCECQFVFYAQLSVQIHLLYMLIRNVSVPVLSLP